MFKRSNVSITVVTALSALVAGLAFGRWSADGFRLTSKAVAATPPASRHSRGLTNVTISPTPSLAGLEAKEATGQHLKPGALADILQEKSGSERLHDLTRFIEQLSPGDFGSALLMARKLARGVDRDLAQRLLVARWAETDPDGTLAFAAKHKEFDQITGDVFQQLASNNLSGALARAQSISDPALHYQAMRGALGVMAASDPAGAVQLAETAGNLPHSEPLSQTIYRQWAETDPAAAAAAAAQDSTGDSGWRSPLGQVIRNWADQDPQAALNYALTLNDTSTQSHTVGDIMRRWSNVDPGAAASWINNQPGGNVRDSAAAAFASSVASTDVSTAVGWAQSISDDNARTSALQRVSRRVLWQDPTNGATTLQSAGVPTEILQNLPPPRGGGR